MRAIPPAALAALQQTSGLEPVIVVRVWWGKTTYTSYCDKKFEQEGLKGSLLQIGGIEDVVDINSTSSSVSLSLTLDDSDGEIKSIYDFNDIHKIRVQVLQWFGNLPLSEAFVLFDGSISSPIVWSEGTRNLSFDVVTELEDREMGFSAEEGRFDFIPASSIGQAWPIIFGTVAGVKAIPLTEAPSAILASGFGIVDQAIWNKELSDMEIASSKAASLRDQCMILFLQYFTLAGIIGLQDIFGDDANIQSQKQQYLSQANQYLNQANQYAVQVDNIAAELIAKRAEKELQESFEFRVLPIAQTNLPTGLQIVVEIGNYTANALVIGNAIVLTDLVEKPNVNDKSGTNSYTFGDQVSQYNQEFQNQKFIWIDGGTQIKIYNFPRYYIAAFGAVNVLNVWSRNKYGRAVVPPNWYVVNVINFGGGLFATRIIFPTPLTTFPGEWQDSDIEVDMEGTVGPNAVDIMIWAIQNFCSFGYDLTSFNHVHAKLANYPCNFALTDRMNIVDFLRDVAFQSRCAIWLNDRKFYLRYLPEELSEVDTITDTDIEVNSLVLTSADTEKIVTKFTATWKATANQSQPNKIIFRYNIKKYGLHEETYNFYIYNNHALVQKSAEFWMIRKSNSFKLLQFNVMLNKLALEAFDPVLIDLNENLASTEPVVGIIQKATFNPDEDTIHLEVWLPVRLGEMTKYKFAQPMNIQDVYPVQSDENIVTGNPYEAAAGKLAPPQTFVAGQQLVLGSGKPFTQGRHQPIGDANDNSPVNLTTRLDPAEINGTRPTGLNTFNNYRRYTINPITNPVFEPITNGSFYGEVLEHTDDPEVYTVKTWLFGFDGSPTTLSVRIGKLRTGSILPEHYPLQVHRVVIKKSETDTEVEYWAQPSIWVPLT